MNGIVANSNPLSIAISDLSDNCASRMWSTAELLPPAIQVIRSIRSIAASFPPADYVNIDPFSGQVTNSASVASIYDVTIDDNLISQAQSQTGKVYATFQCADVEMVRFAIPYVANAQAVGAAGYTINPNNIGQAQSICVDLTSLQGSMLSQDLISQNVNAVDNLNNPLYPVSCITRFGVSINYPDIVQYG